MPRDNYHLVEGAWKTFTIRRVRPEDVEKVIQHIKDYFLHDEPTSKLCGYTEEYGEEFCNVFRYYLSDGMNFWMEDNETGEVAAVRSTFINRKGDSWDRFPKNSRGFQTLNRIVELCWEQINFFERFGIDMYADFLVASSMPKYRNQGLTTELYRRTMVFLKAEGIPLAKSVFTSPYSRAAVKSLGFEEICRVYYKDAKDKDGNLLFDPSELNDEHYGAVLAKVIT